MCNCSSTTIDPCGCNKPRTFAQAAPPKKGCGCGGKCGGKCGCADCGPFVDPRFVQVATIASACLDPCEVSEELSRIREATYHDLNRPNQPRPTPGNTCGDDSGSVAAPDWWSNQDGVPPTLDWFPVKDGDCALPKNPRISFRSEVLGIRSQPADPTASSVLQIVEGRIPNPNSPSVSIVEVRLSQQIQGLGRVVMHLETLDGVRISTPFPIADYNYTTGYWAGTRAFIAPGSINPGFKGYDNFVVVIQTPSVRITAQMNRLTGALTNAVANNTQTKAGQMAERNGQMDTQYTFWLPDNKGRAKWSVSRDAGYTWELAGEAEKMLASTLGMPDLSILSGSFVGTEILKNSDSFWIKAEHAEGTVVEEFIRNPLTGSSQRTTRCQQPTYPAGCAHNRLQLNLPPGVAISGLSLIGTGDVTHTRIDCRTIEIRGTAGTIVGSVRLRRRNPDGSYTERIVPVGTISLEGDCLIHVADDKGPPPKLTVTRTDLPGCKTIYTAKLTGTVLTGPPRWTDLWGATGDTDLSFITSCVAPVTLRLSTSDGELTYTYQPPVEPVITPIPSTTSQVPVTSSTTSQQPGSTTSRPPATTSQQPGGSTSQPPATTSQQPGGSTSQPPASTSAPRPKRYRVGDLLIGTRVGSTTSQPPKPVVIIGDIYVGQPIGASTSSSTSEPPCTFSIGSVMLEGGKGTTLRVQLAALGTQTDFAYSILSANQQVVLVENIPAGPLVEDGFWIDMATHKLPGSTGYTLVVSAKRSENSLSRCTGQVPIFYQPVVTTSSSSTSQPPNNPFQFIIVGYDCTTGQLAYKFNGTAGQNAQVDIAGIVAGSVQINTVYYYTFPSDARIGRLVTGSAVQGSTSISIAFTTRCDLVTNSTTSTPPQQSTTSAPPQQPFGFEIVSYNCLTGELVYRFTGVPGQNVHYDIQGVAVGDTVPGQLFYYTFAADARVGRLVGGSATQGGNTIGISFTTACDLTGSTTSQTGSSTSQQPNEPFNFDIVGYDCNTGRLRYRFKGIAGLIVHYDIQGVGVGDVPVGQIIDYDFPQDARVGRNVFGNAVQGGTTINFNFVTACGTIIVGSSTSTPPATTSTPPPATTSTPPPVSTSAAPSTSSLTPGDGKVDAGAAALNFVVRTGNPQSRYYELKTTLVTAGLPESGQSIRTTDITNERFLGPVKTVEGALALMSRTNSKPSPDSLAYYSTAFSLVNLRAKYPSLAVVEFDVSIRAVVSPGVQPVGYLMSKIVFTHVESSGILSQTYNPDTGADYKYSNAAAPDRTGGEYLVYEGASTEDNVVYGDYKTYARVSINLNTSVVTIKFLLGKLTAGSKDTYVI